MQITQHTHGGCSAAGLIAEGKANSADEIRELMSGNIWCWRRSTQ
jgi:hypothetical protein